MKPQEQIIDKVKVEETQEQVEATPKSKLTFTFENMYLSLIHI